MESMDIFNNTKRKIICINNSHNTWGSDNVSHLLTIGKEYNLVNIDVAAWYSLVTLGEFPNVRFNSVLFKEADE